MIRAPTVLGELETSGEAEFFAVVRRSGERLQALFLQLAL